MIPLLQKFSQTEWIVYLGWLFAGLYDHLFDELIDTCPSGSALNLVAVKLQEACFFSKKAMAEEECNQKKE